MGCQNSIIQNFGFFGEKIASSVLGQILFHGLFQSIALFFMQKRRYSERNLYLTTVSFFEAHFFLCVFEKSSPHLLNH